MGATLRFLGSGDSQGVPRWWCDCGVCADARAGGVNARTRPSVLLHGGGERVLVDAAPELRFQTERAGVRGVDAALVTHAHNDHILGLGDLADRARWCGEPLPVFAPREVLGALEARFGYLWRGAYPGRVPFGPLEEAERTFAGYDVRAHRVPHGFNGHAYGLRFERDGRAWAYLPDSLGLIDLEPWRGLDLLVLGASCYREDAPYPSRSVYDVLEAAELVAELTPRRAVLTHLGHGVDARREPPDGLAYARDGQVLPLP